MSGRLKRNLIAAMALAVALVAAFDGWAQPTTTPNAAGGPAVDTGPAVEPMSKECQPIAAGGVAGPRLPRVAKALEERRRIVVLAIGSTSASKRGPVSGDHYASIERMLEKNFHGLDVTIVHRGVSGELAADAAHRIKNEVALTEADLVLWQLGTADALARVGIEDFRRSVGDTIGWLKAHEIDVILVGLRYAPSIARDAHYQEIRATLRRVAAEHKVLRVGRYAAEELLAKVRRDAKLELSELEAGEVGYACMVEYLARAITAGLFVRRSLPRPQVPPAK